MTNRILGPVSQVEIRDVLSRTKSDVAYSLNCIQVAEIISYDAAKNTASVQIQFKRQLATGESMPYPVLQDCPVVFLSGGTSYLSFPIQAGDTCLVLFNDRDIDTWWLTGEVNVPATPRCHSLSDGFVLVGVRNQTNAEALLETVVVLNGGLQKIVIKNDIANLKLLIDSLITALNGLIITVAGTTGVVSPASQVALNLIKTQFGTLLSDGVP